MPERIQSCCPKVRLIVLLRDPVEQLFPRDQLWIGRSEDLFERPEWVWRELLQWLELDVISLPEMGVRANAGTGATGELGDDSRDRIRSQLHEQLAPTYASMENQYGLVWNAD